MDHLELSPIPGVTVSWVTYLSENDDKDTKFSGFVINLDVEYRDVLGTEDTSKMPEIPGFKYTSEAVSNNTICITVTVLPYGDRNNSDKLTACNKISDDIAVVNTIDNSAKD